jgi:hypothetical protein
VSLFHLGQDHILIGNLLVLEIGLENLNHSEITNRYKQSHRVSLQQQKNNSLPNTHFTEHPCTTQQNSGKSEIFDELQNHKLNTKLVKSTMRKELVELPAHDSGNRKQENKLGGGQEAGPPNRAHETKTSESNCRYLSESRNREHGQLTGVLTHHTRC